MKCGLCLPHCPTYVRARDEGDSPRGRIALMQGLAEGQLRAEGRLAFHLDRCLACRACERACPSGVRYGRLIDASRALVAQRQRAGVGARLARGLLRDRLLVHPRRLRGLARLLRLYQRNGLRRLARGSGLLRAAGLERLDGLLPPLPVIARWKNYYPPAGGERGQVALFTGCLGGILEQEALRATVRLLNHCGYGVHVPSAQTCCGALHLHDGDLRGAAALARRNLRVFNTLDIDAVLYTASGCGATLAEYPGWPPDVGEGGGDGAWEAPVVEAARFLVSALAEAGGPAPTALPRRVAVHEPCTQRNVVRDPESAYRLLERIPDLTVVPLPGNARCCGAAGSYLLSQPGMADALRAEKLAALRGLDADFLATSNIGCALHLAAGVREAGLDIEVVHPVALFERQLKDR